MAARARLVHNPPAPALGLGALGQMMPLFVWLDPAMRIRAVGPTLHRIWAATQHASQVAAGSGAACLPGRFQGGVGAADAAEVGDSAVPCAAGAPHDAVAPPTQPQAGADGLVGRGFADVFDLQRPRHLHAHGNVSQRLRLCLRAAPRTPLRGVALPLCARDPGQGPGGVFVNLSFGIAVADAVRAHGLTDSDFAATDLAVELLYLQEANAAVLKELRGANGRLVTAKASAEEQALTDALTGLCNRRAMDRALVESTRTGAPFGLMHVDLDFFKQVNDTLGHAAGDHVLAEVARGLRAETRAGDIIARVGGDEFVMLFPGLTDRAALTGIAARIIRRLEQPVLWEGQVCRVSASIGFTASTLYARPEPDRLLSDADHALYHSKRTGRGVATPFGPGLRLPG